MFEFAGFGEHFYLFTQDYVANVEFACLTDLYECSHYFESLAVGPFLLELLDNYLKEGFLLIILAFFLKDGECLGDGLGGEAVGGKVSFPEFPSNGILLE